MDYSKTMKSYPQIATRFTLFPSGIGRELRNIRQAVDAGFFSLENGLSPKIYGSGVADIKVAGRSADSIMFLGGWPKGYEKASASWTYATSPDKVVYITAVKPGELGNLINVSWAVGASPNAEVVGLDVTLTVKNDGTTKPSDLQTLIFNNERLKGMIQITSTDDSAIPAAFVTGGMATTKNLSGGTGLGLGFDIQVNPVWGSPAAIAFVAKKPGLAGARYEVSWVRGSELRVEATRKRCTITYVHATTTVAQVVAAVQQNRVAMEHLTPIAAGDGSGVIARLNGEVFKLGLDFGTMVQVGDIYGTIIDLSDSVVVYDYGAQVSVTAGTMANVRFRLGLVDMGLMSFPTIA